MNRNIIVLAIALHTALLVSANADSIQPANPKASKEARQVLNYLYNLPKSETNRIVSGHLAGGSLKPAPPGKQSDAYIFKMDEIEYLHELSGQWVGLIGADYCAGWIITPDPWEPPCTTRT